jgi:surfeit locus 1 family protein
MFQQQKKIKIGNFKTEIIPFFITLSGIIFLISMGIWQLLRLQEKNSFILQVTNNLNNPAKAYSPEQHFLYNKVKLNGKFLSNKNVHLYGRKSTTTDKDGYYLLSPFKSVTGEVFVIARGWFSAKDKAQIVDDYEDSDEEIIGIILPAEHRKFYIPANDLKNNVWFTLDIDEMSKNLNTTFKNFYILQIESQNLPKYLKPLKADGLLNIKNDHLEYAITWFALAICLGGVFIIYNKRKK